MIDRSGKHFGSILCYLRDGTVSLPKGRQAVQELLAEAKYYTIPGLLELCQNTLQVSNRPIIAEMHLFIFPNFLKNFASDRSVV